MNKIITIIVVVVIIAAGVWYFTKGKSGSEVKNDYSTAEQQSQTDLQEGSIKTLIASGKDQKCTFEMPAKDGAGSGKGTFYVTNGKSRGDIEASVAGGTTKSHIISDGNTAYFWIDDSDTAFKMKLDQSATASSSSQAPIDTNSNYKFSCESWKVDQSKFTLPNFQFREFVMPTVPTSTQTINPGDICKSLPEPAKSQCLASTTKQ
jgi:hypothetical protein